MEQADIDLVNPITDEICGAPESRSEWNCMHALQGHGRVERSALFYKQTCLGFDCSNHAFTTACMDIDNNGDCDYTDKPDLGMLIPCGLDNQEPCDLRLGHGRFISILPRQAFTEDISIGVKKGRNTTGSIQFAANGILREHVLKFNLIQALD